MKSVFHRGTETKNYTEKISGGDFTSRKYFTHKPLFVLFPVMLVDRE